MELHKLNESLRNYLILPSTIDFVNAARDFVMLLEDNAIAKEEFYNKSHLCLCKLYLAGFNLELRYPDTEFEYEESKLFENRNVCLISTLGEEGIYTDLFDPVYDQESEPLHRWLEFDYSDIYQALKTNLAKIDKIGTNEAVEDAFWNFKFGFIHAWGNHCIDAMRALHYLKYDGKPIA
jgi:hypothetical protein